MFDAICIASRTVSKCEALKEKLQASYNGTITTAQVDADNTEELIALIEREKPDVVLNLALPYQDLTIMDACLATGVDYVDTANYEPEDTAKFEYKWQWAYREKYEKAGIFWTAMAEIMDIRLQQTSIRRSISVKFLQKDLTGKTDTG